MIPSWRFRCSSLHTLMTEARAIDPALLTEETAALVAKRNKTPEEQAILAALLDRTLSAGAKTMIDNMAKEWVYDYRAFASSKYTTKGTIVENETIALYNRRFFTNYAKNTERRQNDWITGECDIDTGEMIVDVKSSWSLETFPATAEKAHKIEYEWQMRGYMWLWEREKAVVAYGLVDTPEELIGYEDRKLHCIEERDMPIELRITTVTYHRDRALEEKIKLKAEAGYERFNAQVLQIQQEHDLA